MPKQTLDRKYEYRRMLPHYQKAGRVLFVTFCKGNRIPLLQRPVTPSSNTASMTMANATTSMQSS